VNYLKVLVQIADEPEQEILVAQLSQLNFIGFEQREDYLLAYSVEGEVQFEDFESFLKNYEWQQELIPELNWNAEWEKSFDPIELEHVRIRAHFHQAKDDGAEEIIITPRMSFGTGHHSTTQLMLEEMNVLEFKDKDVLDYGTGTGVLAIYASKLGAQKVLGIDIDPWSVDNSKENILRNDCEDVQIELGGIEIVDVSYDIILANINLNVILESLKSLHRALNASGQILFSGVLTKDLDNLKEAVKPYFKAVREQRLNNWIMLYCEKM